jgi:hypothetical protein
MFIATARKLAIYRKRRVYVNAELSVGEGDVTA